VPKRAQAGCMSMQANFARKGVQLDILYFTAFVRTYQSA
jgi:hypothetical protein